MSTVDSERDTDGIPERRLEFETMIADISSRFVHLSPDELDLTIEGALRRVCAFLGVELAVLWQWSAADPRVITPTHVHCSPGIPRPSEPMRQEQYPWARQQMLAGRGFALSSLAEYPAEAAVDRETCRSLGIRSGICLPLAMDGEAPVGALGLSSLSAERPWPRALVKRLELVASVLTNALARRRHELSLRESEARLAAGIEIAGLAYFEVDLGARAVFVDDRFRALCGIPADRERELQIVEYWMDHLHLSDAPRVLELRQQVEAGKVEQFHLEYRYLHPVRGEIWLQHIGRAAERDANGLAIRTYGVLRDITERRRAEEELRRSHAEIEQLRDRLQAEADYLKAEIRVIHPYGEITGHSAAIQKVLEQVARVAPTDSSVLVLGETGTGKELVAQAIHRLSPRRSRLMVKVNCAALPSGLVESELFGREKGAYTGALTRQVGRFEVADGSTLFLDEIGELSLELQAKLLRVLEAGEFERLGSSRTLKVDVRVIAASNRDLIQEINKGRFRADLFYRLNVFPIRVPPLRERAEDIAQLVWAFLEEFSARMGKKITQVPRRTMEALQRQPWPGNVRELRNLIEHAAIITDGPILRLPAFDEERSAAAPARTLAEAERGHILRALERAGWHVKGPNGAAVELGLKPATLYSRMKKLGIRPRRQAPDRIA